MADNGSAMRSCPFCAEDIQDAAVVCKHCQHPVKASTAAPSQADQRPAAPVSVLGALLALGSLGAIAFVVVAMMAAPSTPPAPHDKATAYAMCQDWVKGRLQSPGSADFPFGDVTKTEDLGHGAYRIRSYVDSQNGFGALVRTKYDCSTHWVSGQNWHLDRLATE